MYEIIGWFNVGLLGIIILPYVLVFMIKRQLLINKINVKPFMKLLRSLHKPAGALLILSGAIHGYMALGGFRLHTGSLVYISIIIAALMGLLYHLKKKKQYFKIHKLFVLITLFFLAVHLLFPSALDYLLK